LEEDGLAFALEAYAEQRLDPDSVQWEITDELGSDPAPTTASLAYRLAREALSNVVKHANARSVRVTLTTADSGLSVVVADDGVGFETSNEYRDKPGHLGLTSCHYLARRALGWWRISSSPLGGTVVEFWLPHTPN
jgi:signal transduction histidine kinase